MHWYIHGEEDILLHWGILGEGRYSAPTPMLCPFCVREFTPSALLTIVGCSTQESSPQITKGDMRTSGHVSQGQGFHKCRKVSTATSARGSQRT